MKRGKNYKKAEELYEKNKLYSMEEALEILKKFPEKKFDEAVEVHFKLGIDARKSDQAVRGSVTMPHGTGKELKIIAFTEKQAKEAASAGADKVGGEELIEEIKASGQVEFDVAVASPEMMPKLAKIAKILGPRGLMPNAKTNTVGPNLKLIIDEVKKGKVNFKNDDSGNVHQVIGKKSFDVKKLKENYDAFQEALTKSRPAASKGKYIQNISLSLTMSPSIKIAN